MSPGPVEIRAAVLEDKGKPLRVQTLLLAPPGRDEVLVRCLGILAGMIVAALALAEVGNRLGRRRP